MENKVGTVDRISQLPEPVLQRILSFFPIKQVLQSSVLSKRWKHVWNTFPILQFDKTYFDPKLWRPDNKNQDIQRKRRELFNFVETTLHSRRRQSLRIQKFTLSVSLDTARPVVDRWIGFLVESNVEELNLDFKGPPDNWYRLPRSVLVAKSITVLTLCGCKLESPCGDINLSSLKKLSLCDVSADDQVIQNLFDGCPVIENMRFRFCRGFRSMKLFSLPKLMAIEGEYNRELKRLELEAPNLYMLHIDKSITGGIACKNLRVLKLSGRDIADKWLQDQFSELPLLEILKLHGCPMLERIKISSRHLKILDLIFCDKLVDVEIDTPKLCKLAYLGGGIRSFSLNAPALSELTFQMRTRSCTASCPVERIQFFSKLSNCKSLALTIGSAENMIIPEELREILPSPSCNVKHLKLFRSPPCESDELVDSLLWISPLSDILSIRMQ